MARLAAGSLIESNFICLALFQLMSLKVLHVKNTIKFEKQKSKTLHNYFVLNTMPHTNTHTMERKQELTKMKKSGFVLKWGDDIWGIRIESVKDDPLWRPLME